LWKKIVKVQDPSNRALFFCSTYMHIGNRENTPFSEAKWLHGAAPKDLAFGLFKITRLKNRMVSTELTNNGWIRSLPSLDTPSLLEEYTTLYTSLTSIQLTNDSDVIVWRWTADGKYSVKLAYECQFRGAFTFFPAEKVWKAYTALKCNFFAWLVLHNKALIADNMSKRNWPCNPSYSLCFCLPKTTDHLLTNCNYVEALW
jgi:hypothetical protein